LEMSKILLYYAIDVTLPLQDAPVHQGNHSLSKKIWICRYFFIPLYQQNERTLWKVLTESNLSGKSVKPM